MHRYLKLIPLYSLALSLLLVALHFLPNIFDIFYFNSAKFFGGEWWRLFTAQAVHVDYEHLALNLLTLLLLGFFFERDYQRSPYGLLLCGICAVAMQLPFSGLDAFCGISGAINALIVPVAWKLWVLTRQPFVWIFVVLHFGRLMAEWILGRPLASDLVWPSYPPSHLLGFLAGCAWLFWFDRRASKNVSSDF